MLKSIARLTAIAVATLALTATAALAAPKPAAEIKPAGVKNIVLVHGAFADGSSWSKVAAILIKKGYHVTAVQNPLTSVSDDVASVKRALALLDGPAILAGHSYGGAVITEAGADPKVVGLVYVAAFGPDVGETLNDSIHKYPPPPAFAHPIVDKQGFLSLPEDSVVEHFVQDLPKPEARLVYAVQGPINAAGFDYKFPAAAWKTKPSWYIVAKRDGAIQPDLERFFAQRMKATTTELDSAHVPMLSRPADVARVLIEAATKAAPK